MMGETGARGGRAPVADVEDDDGVNLCGGHLAGSHHGKESHHVGDGVRSRPRAARRGRSGRAKPRSEAEKAARIELPGDAPVAEIGDW